MTEVGFPQSFLSKPVYVHPERSQDYWMTPEKKKELQAVPKNCSKKVGQQMGAMNFGGMAGISIVFRYRRYRYECIIMYTHMYIYRIMFVYMYRYVNTF